MFVYAISLALCRCAQHGRRKHALNAAQLIKQLDVRISEVNSRCSVLDSVFPCTAPACEPCLPYKRKCIRNAASELQHNLKRLLLVTVASEAGTGQRNHHPLSSGKTDIQVTTERCYPHEQLTMLNDVPRSACSRTSRLCVLGTPSLRGCGEATLTCLDRAPLHRAEEYCPQTEYKARLSHEGNCLCTFVCRQRLHDGCRRYCALDALLGRLTNQSHPPKTLALDMDRIPVGKQPRTHLETEPAIGPVANVPEADPTPPCVGSRQAKQVFDQVDAQEAPVCPNAPTPSFDANVGERSRTHSVC